MKTMIAIFLSFVQLTVWASSDKQTFFYDGTQDNVFLTLQAEKTHTEYRYEDRRTICYRQEVFYRTICQPDGRGRRICRQVPQYRTISYPCIQTIRIPYEVKDYDVEADVEIKIDSLPVETAGERFEVTLDGDELSLKVIGSKKYFIVLKKESINSSMQGSVKYLDAVYVAELIEASPIMDILNLSEMSLKDTSLNFKTGLVKNRKHVGFSLTVKKAPVLGSDTVLFDRELTESEIQLSPEDKVTFAEIGLDKLGIDLTGGRHSLTAKVFFKHQGKLLNSDEFDRTEAAKTLIYKAR